MKCNQSCPGFELVSPSSFPTTLTITSRAPPFCKSKCFDENFVEILVEFFVLTCFCYYYCWVPLPKTTVIYLLLRGVNLKTFYYFIAVIFFGEKRFLHRLLIQPTTHTFLFNKTSVFTPPSCRKQLWRSLIICLKIHPLTFSTLDPSQAGRLYDLSSSNTIPPTPKPPVMPVSWLSHCVNKNQQVTTKETGSKNMPVITRMVKFYQYLSW